MAKNPPRLGASVSQIPVDQFKPSDVEIQACFRHENIAELYGAVLWGETVHLFMEAGEGGSVLEKLESCGPMREFEIIWVTKHVLKGLDFLHSKKVIHHDIKREYLLGQLPGEARGVDGPWRLPKAPRRRQGSEGPDLLGLSELVMQQL